MTDIPERQTTHIQRPYLYKTNGVCNIRFKSKYSGEVLYVLDSNSAASLKGSSI